MRERRRLQTSRRPALPGESRTDRRVSIILVVYLVMVGTIVGYTSTSIAHERGSAVVVNIASRQRALAERFMKDVILVANGLPADPSDDAAQLLANANALLFGGEVIAVRGADAEVEIEPASEDPVIVEKLGQERRLIDDLLHRGDELMHLEAGTTAFEAAVHELRLAGALVTGVSNDAVGALTEDTEGAFGRLVLIAIALGALGAACAVGMGLLMRRAGVRSASTFRSLVNNASDLITVVDAEGAITYQSPSSSNLLGLAPEPLVGKAFRELVDPDDRSFYDALLVNARGADGLKGEFRLRHHDGSVRHVETIVSRLARDRTLGALLFNTRDVTDRRRLEDELQRQAFFDSLTGLSNRAVFRDRLEHALSRVARTREPIAVMLLDLDGFKVVNDSLGHDVGDELLVEAAHRILERCRASDTVARLGGDEFAILLEDGVSNEAATSLAQRLHETLADPFEIRGREVFIGASIGIALDVAGDDAPDDLIRNADTAMYEAKAAGKGRSAIFHPAMHQRTLEFFEIHGDLQHALVRGEFVLHYQPIVDLTTGEVEAVEALVRWQHPTRGLLPPSTFIQVAEETGMIVPLGVWVLGEACRQTAAWRRSIPAAAGLSVNVNLSTRQLLEADLVPRVSEVLSESGLDPTALTLEVTEGSLMQDVEQTAAKLRALKELGIRLALDDFGTGSSSLGYLQQFPIDVLKIDKSFVDGVAEPGSDASALVTAIIELARTLHLGTVAEGIETSAQVDALRPTSCQGGQGFLFARPLDRRDLEATLRRAPVAPLDPSRTDA
jgi:diguanylate cyclase (GGDEF)-like protein/PAS domain S-box-containing protein